jgi:hypothetical protein
MPQLGLVLEHDRSWVEATAWQPAGTGAGGGRRAVEGGCVNDRGVICICCGVVVGAARGDIPQDCVGIREVGCRVRYKVAADDDLPGHVLSIGASARRGRVRGNIHDVSGRRHAVFGSLNHGVPVRGGVALCGVQKVVSLVRVDGTVAHVGGRAGVGNGPQADRRQVPLAPGVCGVDHVGIGARRHGVAHRVDGEVRQVLRARVVHVVVGYGEVPGLREGAHNH